MTDEMNDWPRQRLTVLGELSALRFLTEILLANFLASAADASARADFIARLLATARRTNRVPLAEGMAAADISDIFVEMLTRFEALCASAERAAASGK